MSKADGDGAGKANIVRFERGFINLKFAPF